jgi:small subunit ribosomal protein S1
MSSDAMPESGSLHPDDSFWSALFKEEESLSTPTKQPVEEQRDVWSSLNGRLDGRFRWSDGKAPQKDPWEIVSEAFDDDKTVKLEVADFNKGGLLVQWQTLQGFVPASQLIEFPQFHLETERLRALKSWVGKSLSLKIIELNRESNRLILSERAALVCADDRDTLLHQISVGDQLVGHVTNLTNFGAFVDLGGVEGLIHISELSWSRVIHPSDIVKPGKRVEVHVLNVDQHNGRIALSLKRLKHDPWKTVDERFEPGQLVKGIISNVVSFGAFVMIEDELEGLIHISELAEGNFLHPRNVVQQGQNIVARILSVDGRSKRLALSLRKVDQSAM